ncbi:MAG: B12-binding domain-containing radical SAM protein, partial [Planctomycetia bacterium]
MSQNIKDRLRSLLVTGIQTPGQYIGGELGAVVKDHAAVRGKLCLAFPDAYSIGMSHHGFQVLYHLMNQRDDWVCERAFAPWPDMEELLRREELPLYGLETGTPLLEFDVVGFTMQYELCATNLLTMLDLGRIPIHAEDRSLNDPLVTAGGPQAFVPEPMAPFIDLFVIGDGEEMLGRVCDAWLEAKSTSTDREEALLKLATTLPHVYVPRFYRVDESRGGPLGPLVPTRDDVPTEIHPAVVRLEDIPIVTRPILPMVECVQERITIELMRGCPWTCKFCQSSVIKHPVRFR